MTSLTSTLSKEMEPAVTVATAATAAPSTTAMWAETAVTPLLRRATATNCHRRQRRRPAATAASVPAAVRAERRKRHSRAAGRLLAATVARRQPRRRWRFRRGWQHDGRRHRRRRLDVRPDVGAPALRVYRVGRDQRRGDEGRRAERRTLSRLDQQGQLRRIIERTRPTDGGPESNKNCRRTENCC